ncbi:glutathione S-transferase C-terminal domain-containing protein [Archangium sp.]|uniref:glutathione S-transferase C-terminal domain-containing protein n=1 Tax=Archangium sp. TaxID=1872627 RepID=UPI002D65EFEB|nr:glutathione S-transferase C-terminal domain-containing protein [Archangium sp.]HYO60222.1 glutathione S-transferase C-terminal domain-containing protein [Archangium sp.]
MLILHQGPTAWGIGNVGPFCLKLESYLRMTGVAYTTRAADMRRAPKGKVPFIEEDGTLLGDSQLIIEHLKRKHGDPLDAKLGAEDITKGHMVRRVLEESTYWHLIHERWVMQEGWRIYKPIFEAIFPPVIGKLVLPMIRRKVIQSARAQGLGRHRPEEILEMGKADISAVAVTLGDKPFLLGEHPTSFDATVYAFIVSITAFPVDSPFRKYTLAQENLVRYCERFQQRFFADGRPSADSLPGSPPFVHRETARPVNPPPGDARGVPRVQGAPTPSARDMRRTGRKSG